MNNRLDALLEAVDAAILTISSNGIVTDCNDATSRMFGYSKHELVGNNVKMLMPQPYQSEHDQYIQNHLTTGVNRIIGIGRKVTARHRSGSLIPVHLSVAKFAEQGKTYFSGILHDLSELDRVASANERLGLILEESMNEIYTFDAESLGFISANRAALDNIGYTMEELFDMTPVDICCDQSESQLRSSMQPLIHGELQRSNLDARMRRKDGSEYEVELTLHYSTLIDPPEMAVIAQDVTERKRLAESLRRNQRMESIGNLTGGIAHDFNNILTVIKGNLELMQLEVSDPDSVELLDDAHEAVEMGARLTSRLLAFARRSPLQPDRTNVNRLIVDLNSMLQRTLGSNIRFELKLADDLWDIDVDVSELENALVNLAINARDAMPDGGCLVIETKNCVLDTYSVINKELAPGQYICISVADTGSGIDASIKESIFEPFVTSKSGGKGSGLGLSMVHGFVHQSGGGITLYSEPDQGAMFSLYLPRSQADAAYHQTSTAEQTEHRASGRKILIAEDDPRVRKLTTKRIAILGHQVLAAADGYEALALFREHPEIDLVFTDVVMTEGMTGYDLAVAVREIDTTTPILLTSGYAEDIVNAEKLHKTDLSLLRKPYSQAELEEAIAQIFLATEKRPD